MEEYAIVIEYLPQGHSSDIKRQPTIQLVGYRFFTLLEAIVTPTSNIVVGKKVYVGKEKREEIEKVKGRLAYNDLTSSAKDVLPTIIKKIINEREKDFVDFLNDAGPLSIRVHQLELLPGIGKKHMNEILEKREERPFDSFADVKTRVTGIADPVIVFLNRILKEMEGKEKYYLFVRPQFQRF